MHVALQETCDHFYGLALSTEKIASYIIAEYVSMLLKYCFIFFQEMNWSRPPIIDIHP